MYMYYYCFIAAPPQVPVSMRPEKRSNEYMYIGVTPETLPPPSDVLYLQDVAKVSICT